MTQDDVLFGYRPQPFALTAARSVDGRGSLIGSGGIENFRSQSAPPSWMQRVLGQVDT